MCYYVDWKYVNNSLLKNRRIIGGILGIRCYFLDKSFK
nr:MAG TPA: hypothetical protein [Caudoviricetes sp.]